MFNKKRGVIFGILFIFLFLLIFFPQINAFELCYSKDAPHDVCPHGMEDYIDSCCWPEGTECASNADCDDFNSCTSNACLMDYDTSVLSCEYLLACPIGETCTVIDDYDYGCSGDSSNCNLLEEYIGDFNYCVGSWTETIQTSCTGSWIECESDPMVPATSFFALLTGRVTSIITGKSIHCLGDQIEVNYSCSGPTTSAECTSQNEVCVFTSGSTTTYQCSAEYGDGTSCDDADYCESVGECLPKKDDCDSCTENMECLSNNCVDNTCIPLGGCCLDSDCLDTNLCTTDTCVSNSCVHTSNCPLGCWKTATGECYRGLCEGIKWTEIQSGVQRCSDSYIAKLLPTPQQTEEIDAKCVTRGEDTCVIDSESSCTMPSGTSMCFENAPEIFVCTTDGPEEQDHWMRMIGSTACVPSIIWQDGDGLIITSIDLYEGIPLATVDIRFINYISTGLKEINFEIIESDDGEGVLNFDDNILTINGTYDENEKDLIATWEIESKDVEKAVGILDQESDGVFEFYVELGEFTSPILYATKNFNTCSNNLQDYGEEGIDCGEVCENECIPESCFDDVKNNDETSIDCGGSCPACIKETLWTSSSEPYSEYDESTRQMTVDDIVAGTYTFRMLLNEPTSENEEFVIKEDDFIGDATIQEGLIGAYDINSNLEYFWTPTMTDFLAGGTGNDYEFYFEVDGEKSSNLIIEVDTTGETNGEFPTCSDDIMNGDEIDIDCGGSCPNQDCVSVCFSKNVCANYATEGDCNADICNVAENSVPNLGEDETATCEWSVDICTTTTSTSFNGIDIGSCTYLEDTDTDNCDDGYLSYSWVASWGWDSGNNYLFEADCGVDCVEDLGQWHYDPQSAYLDCVDGSQTIPCPAQIQLNFFTWKNFFAAALLVLIIYIILRNSKVVKKKIVKKKKKKTIRKKKVVKKKK